jgi:hypothetical protein
MPIIRPANPTKDRMIRTHIGVGIIDKPRNISPIIRDMAG